MTSNRRLGGLRGAIKRLQFAAWASAYDARMYLAGMDGGVYDGEYERGALFFQAEAAKNAAKARERLFTLLELERRAR